MNDQSDNAAADADFVAAINNAAKAMVAGLLSEGSTLEEAEAALLQLSTTIAEGHRAA